MSVPFWGLISLLTFILYKDMHITPLQMTLFIIIKPMSALFSPYWSQVIHQRPDRIVSNLIWGNILRYLPFLFVPWINSAWIIIGAFGLYMMFYRGTSIVWAETIKTNIPPLSQEKLIAFGSALDHCAIALLPFILGSLLDTNPQAWRWLFPLTAAFGLLSTAFIYYTPASKLAPTLLPIQLGAWDLFKRHILKPWKDSWQLIKKDTNFSHFQIGFMLGGASLMILQSTIPILFADVLKLSYTKLLIAMTICKSVGYVLTTPLWVKFFRRVNIYYFSSFVTILVALFPFLLLSSQIHILFLYCAFALYGIIQAGSELSWHMSGPIFAKEKDSTIFSGTNVLAVGIRGCVIPPLGALLYTLTNSVVVMIAGSLLGLLATAYFIRYSAAPKIEEA